MLNACSDWLVKLFKAAQAKKNDNQLKEKTEPLNGMNRSTVFHLCDTRSVDWLVFLQNVSSLLMSDTTTP